MSTLGNKGDKNQGKYKAIDINNLYKGTSVTPQKPTPASNRQHGLQSLGKVANLRRMPPPANLPSLKSENIGVPETISASSNSGWTKDDAPSDIATSPVAVPQNSSPLLQPSSQLQDHAPAQAPDVSQSRTLSSNAGGPVLWSNVTSGGRKPGSFLDQKSVMFQEEFPQLPFGSEEKISTPRKEDENREAFHGPGLNLRPQNEGSWRDGGGRVSNQPMQASEDLNPQSVSQASVGDSDAAAPIDASKNSAVQSPLQFRGPMPVMPVRPGMPPPPPHLGQMPFVPASFRHPMMMPFGFRPGFPPNYPPNFLPPGMPRPPFMNPADLRFQGMYPMQGWNYPCGPGTVPASGSCSIEDASLDRPAIVKDKDLEDFDRLAISDDGWARNDADVDYSERLVFSDEEDIGPADKSEKVRGEKPPLDNSGRDRREREIANDSRARRDPYEGQRTVGQDRLHDAVAVPSVPKEVWMPQNMPSQHVRPTLASDRRPWPAEVPYDMQPSAPYNQPPLMQLRPPLRPPVSPEVQTNSAEPDEDEMWRQRRKQQSESMSAAIERARQRREEEERRMKEEQTAAAREKLRQLDEKLGKKDDKLDTAADKSKHSADDLKEDGRRRNNSDCSDKPNMTSSTHVGAVTRSQQQMPKSDSPSGIDAAEMGHRGTLSSPSGSTSPRPLQQIPARLPAPPRASSPGFWSCDPRAWSNMPLPHRFMMDPRMFMMSARAPIPGMPLRMPMRQSSATESSADGNDHEQALRGHWYDQSLYGIYPRGPVGPYDQHAVRGPGPHGYFGLSAHDYEQCEESGESNQRLPLSRGRLYDVYRERTDFATAELSDSQSSVPMAWADQTHLGSDDTDASSTKVDGRAKQVLSQHDVPYSVRRTGDLAARDLQEFGSTDSLGSCRNAVHQEIDRNDIEDDQNYRDNDQGLNRRRKENVSQKTSQDERYFRLNSSGGCSSAAAVKRTHSSASNSSAASSERKTDSPRDTRTLERFTSKDMTERTAQKSSSQELSKSNSNTVPLSLDSDKSYREDKFNISDLKAALPTEHLLSEEKPQKRQEVSKRDLMKIDDSQKTIDRPPAKKIKNGGQAVPTLKHKQENVDSERIRVSVGSREFVRGGRARMRGSGRGRGRGYRDEFSGYSDAKSSGVGYRGNEDEDEYDLHYSFREQNARHSAEEKKKVDVVHPSGKLQIPVVDPDYLGNEGSSKHKLDTTSTARGGARAQNQRNEPRAPRRNDISSNQKKDTAANIQSNQHNSSGLKYDSSVLPVHNDQDCNSKTDPHTSVDLRSGQRQPRNFGNKSRRNNRPQDQPKQQATESETGDQDAYRHVAQQRNDISKSEPASSANTVQGRDGTNELFESKRPPGSNRRRRPRTSGKRNAAGGSNSDAVDAGSDRIESVQAQDLKQETKLAPQTASQPVQSSLKDNSRPSDKFPGNEGRSNAPRPRQRREGSGKKTERSQVPLQHGGLHSDHLVQAGTTTSGGNNEEWETASESSDVLRGSAHHQPPQRRDRDGETTDKRDAKKSFTGQRPVPSRRGGHSDQRGGDRGMREEGTGANRADPRREEGTLANRADPRRANGSYDARAPQNNQVVAPRLVNSSARPSSSVAANGQNGPVHTVYRIDGVVYNHPQVIEKALKDIAYRCRGSCPSVENLGRLNHQKSELETMRSELQTVARSHHRLHDNNGKQCSKVRKTTNVGQEGKHRNQELPPRLAKQLCGSRKVITRDEWLSSDYNAQRVSKSTDSMTVLRNSDRHDSGIDLSDLPNSSCCSSPFEELSPDHSFTCNADRSSSTIGREEVLGMSVTTSGKDQKDLQLLANTINLSSVRSIWQKTHEQMLTRLTSVWSRLDLGHDLVHNGTDLIPATELDSTVRSAEILTGKASDDVMLAADFNESCQRNERQSVSGMPTALMDNTSCQHQTLQQLEGVSHSALGSGRDTEYKSAENDACADDDIDITIADYKTDEDTD